MLARKSIKFCRQQFGIRFKYAGISGIYGGTMVQEVIIDKKGRIVIPRRFREKLDLGEGSKVRLALEEGKIVIMRHVAPEEFIHEMEGCVKEGSQIPKIDPLELKRIWEQL